MEIMLMCRYLLCFIFYSFIGWMYECVFYSVQHKKFVNSGFLNGCLCPIYGIGALLILILLSSIENPVQLFFSGMIVTGVLEYFTSWFLEEMFHERWWDYTGWAFNINGRVCLLGALAFGTLTVLLVKAVDPFTQQMLDGFSDFTVYVLTALTAAALLTDTAVTVKNINLASKKLWFVKKQSELIEKRKEYMRMKFQSLSAGGFAGISRSLYIKEDRQDSITERIRKFFDR